MKKVVEKIKEDKKIKLILICALVVIIILVVCLIMKQDKKSAMTINPHGKYEMDYNFKGLSGTVYMEDYDKSLLNKGITYTLSFIDSDNNEIFIANNLKLSDKRNFFVSNNVKKYKITFKNKSDDKVSLKLKAKIKKYNFKQEKKANETLKKLSSLNKTIKLNQKKYDFRDLFVNNGLYAADDSYGTSYYFRGNVDNNIVKFAGNFYRIVRINGDGSLRLMYMGPTADSKDVIEDSTFNPLKSEVTYVGYMYGEDNTEDYIDSTTNTNDSDIKKVLDKWYETNLTKYANYISDEVFCNDRTIFKAKSLDENYTDLGYGNNLTAYGTLGRLGEFEKKSDITPSLICKSNNDAFTVSNPLGNSSLKYPIGLITADELVLGGNIPNSENHDTYFYKEKAYYTMSPAIAGSNGGIMYMLDKNGTLSKSSTDDKIGVVPVINIKYDYVNKITGEGTATKPFVIEGAN